MKKLRTCLAILVTLATVHADPGTRVDWFNGLGTELKDFLGVPLTPGNSTPFDGTLLQLGYYSFATDADPFAGVWIALTGTGSNNGILSTIGDKEVELGGRFDLSTGFTVGSLLDGFDLPPSTSIPLSIRFYGGFTADSSTYYNAVSNTTGAWNWQTPSDTVAAVVTISLSDAGLAWEGGGGSDFRTTIVTPEPSAAAMLLLGNALLMQRRRKKLK